MTPYEATDAQSAPVSHQLGLTYRGLTLSSLSSGVSGYKLKGGTDGGGNTSEHQANKDVKSHLLGS